MVEHCEHKWPVNSPCPYCEGSAMKRTVQEMAKEERAFPIPDAYDDTGMSLRDYAAIKFMAARLSSAMTIANKFAVGGTPFTSEMLIELRKNIASAAFKDADAFLAEREEK